LNKRGKFKVMLSRTGIHAISLGKPLRTQVLSWVVDELKRLKPSLAQPDDLVFKVGNFTKSWQSALKLADLPTDWTFRLSAISPRRSWLTPAGPWSPSCRR